MNDEVKGTKEIEKIETMKEQKIIYFNWFKIYQSMLPLIIQFLSHIEYFNIFIHVCQDWSKLHNLFPIIWPSIHLENSKNEFKYIVGIIRKCTKYVTKLILDQGIYFNFDLKIATTIFKHLQYLRIANNSHLSNYDLECLLSLSNLQTLELIKCSQINIYCLQSISKMNNLFSLSFHNNYMFADNSIEYISKLKNLISLTIKYCRRLSDVSLQHISNIANLRELDISHNEFTDIGIAYLIKLQNLQSINMSYCYKLTDDSVELICHLPKLENLNIGNCMNLKGDHEKFDKLTKLKLRKLVANDCCINSNILFCAQSTLEKLYLENAFINNKNNILNKCIFTKLYCLDIRRCVIQLLNRFAKSKISHLLAPTLKIIMISDCEKKSILRTLSSSIEKIIIEDTSNLNNILYSIPIFKNLYSISFKNCHNSLYSWTCLQNLITLNNLRNLNLECELFNETNIISHLISIAKTSKSLIKLNSLSLGFNFNKYKICNFTHEIELLILLLPKLEILNLSMYNIKNNYTINKYTTYNHLYKKNKLHEFITIADLTKFIKNYNIQNNRVKIFYDVRSLNISAKDDI